MFGEGHEVEKSGRAATSHTPGGTGALRVAADFIHQQMPNATVWLTQPTWPNHPQIFAAAGVPTKSFPYFDAKTNSLAFEEAIAAIQKMPAGDVIMLHGCCHNPTGIDPTPEQWEPVADAIYDRGLLPLLDFAYQGFADGINEDAVGLRAFCRPGAEFIVCSSFSKNFGLYCERVGALTMVAKDKAAADTVQSQVKAASARTIPTRRRTGPNWSRPCSATASFAKSGKRRWPKCAAASTACASCLVKTLKAQRRPRRLLVHHPATRHVFVLRPDAAASGSPEAEIRDLHRRLRPDQCRRHHRAKRRPVVRGDCGGGKIEPGIPFLGLGNHVFAPIRSYLLGKDDRRRGKSLRTTRPGGCSA